MSPASGGTRTIHDRFGVMPKACQQKVIAETSAATVVRDYIWLPQGAPTGVDMPVMVVDNVDTTPVS